MGSGPDPGQYAGHEFDIKFSPSLLGISAAAIAASAGHYLFFEFVIQMV